MSNRTWQNPWRYALTAIAVIAASPFTLALTDDQVIAELEKQTASQVIHLSRQQTAEYHALLLLKNGATRLVSVQTEGAKIIIADVSPRYHGNQQWRIHQKN
jgi:hypothetical protein